MYNKHFLVYFLVFFATFTRTMCQETTADHTITVFVHGTFPVRKILQYSPGRFLIYCPQGLSLAKNLPKNYHFYKMAQGCVDLDPQRYSFDQFYIFGWKSEHVYHSTRMQAAADLVKSLQKLVNDYYAKHHTIPKIQLIGFSHGGNVVLNTANYLPLIVENKQVVIEAWLFGTPVQQANQASVNSPNFNKIYSIYSEKDWLQRMDPQGLYNKKCRKNNFWSDRMFDLQHQCMQVKFTVNSKPISHSYYRCIFKYLPKIQRIVEEKATNSQSKMIDVNLET